MSDLSSPSSQVGLLVIAGPTAVGKTGLAVELAQKMDAELVGADSMQVYREMNIGTGKPSAQELRGVPHHLLDVVDPEEQFDAARYVDEADRAIAAADARGRRVIVVGGTGLYIRALLHGLQPAPPPDPAVRSSITARAEAAGWPAMHAELFRLDPETAGRLQPNDGVRILRALEVIEQTGRSISTWQRSHGFTQRRYHAAVIGIERPRAELNSRIQRISPSARRIRYSTE